MPDLKTQLRAYYESTTVPTDIDPIIAGREASNSGLRAPARRSVAMSIVPLSSEPDQRSRRRGTRLAAAGLAAAAIVAAVVLIAVAVSDDGSSPASPPPTVAVPTTMPASVGELLDAYVDAYNAHDIAAVMSLFADDAVMTGNLVSPGAEGTAEIRAFQEGDMAIAAPDNAYAMTDVEVNGNTVTFGHIWHHQDGSCYSGTGHRVEVEGGQIVRWDFGTDSQPCPTAVLLLDAYVDAYNAHDIAAVMSLFADNAEMTGNLVSPGAQGTAEIRAFQEGDMAIAAPDNAYAMTDLEVDGNTVTFGHIWHHQDGNCYSGTGHRVEVEGGQIVRWDFGTDSQPCQ